MNNAILKNRLLSSFILVMFLTVSLTGCTGQTTTKTIESQKQEITQLNDDLKTATDALNELKATSETQVKTLEENSQTIQKLTSENETLKTQLAATVTTTTSVTLLNQALTVVTLLKNKDMANLAPIVHPTLGVRFTSYGYVDTANDIVLQGSQLQTQLASAATLTWGSYDGSGDPIQVDFNTYYDEFVYDEDYENPNLIGNNVIIGTGNTIENIGSAYPGDSFVEFHFTGFDPQYAGIDWSSLRLVFTNVSGTWYLVGIVHAQWTI